MNVLITNFHPRNGGGHVTYVLNLVKGLRDRCRFTIATPASSRLYRYAREENIDVVDMRFTMRPASWWSERRAFSRLVRDRRFDLVHVNGSADHKQVMLSTLGWKARPKIVLTKHNDHPVKSIGHQMRARLATDHVIAVSDYVGGLLQRSPYARVPISVVRHGIDTDYFVPVAPAERIALRQHYCPQWTDRIVLGSSGGTDLAKGWLDLAEALLLLPEVVRDRFGILVAGDVPREAHLQRLAQLGLSDYLRFPGLMDDVRPILGACDIGFVLSHREALSFACREIMAMGLPALISDAGGLPENVEANSDGWIVPVGNKREIAGILQQCLTSKLLQTMGANARRKSATEFSLETMATRTAAIYRSTLLV